MRNRVVWIAVFAMMVSGCLSPAAVTQCDDGRICPADKVCVGEPYNLCVAEEQVSQCAAMPDRTECVLDGALATCQQGLCLETSCGNARLDLTQAAACEQQMADGSCALPYELCDDGNNLDGDGCAGNCQSTEVCGNRIVDAAKGEICDDGNNVDHDGCSSACQPEVARWELATDPGQRSQAAAVYDAARHKVVMFGGRVYANGASPVNGQAPPPSIASNEVWEWDGVWRHVTDVPEAPAARDVNSKKDQQTTPISFAIAYDHARGYTVLAGGAVAGQALRDVWAWNGRRWSHLPDLPFRLRDHAMAYDAKRERIVLFGGHKGDGTLNGDTYELNGTSWVKSPASGPPAGSKHAMGYDPKRGVIVLYGGEGGTSQGDALWEYDGAAWTQRLFTGVGNPFQPQPQVAYDVVSERLVFLWGDRGTGAEMYFWDGTQLIRYPGQTPLSQVPASPPFITSDRVGTILVPDGRGRLLLYGGQAKNSSFSDSHLLRGQLMWLFDGQSWVEPPDPPILFGYAVAQQYDRGRVVRYGGAAGNVASRETWELSSAGWQRTATDGPPELVFASMAHDTARDQLILFGGGTASGISNEMWVRAGSGGPWTRVPTVGSWPPPRFLGGLVFDAARGRTILFGGTTGPSEIRDMWIWNGATWTEQVLGASDPPMFEDPAIGYDWANNVVVVLGSENDMADPTTWIWDGAWHDVTTALVDRPPPRIGGTLTWNAARRSLILTQSNTFGTAPLDTWELQITSVSPPAGTWRRLALPSSPANRFWGLTFSTLDGSGISLYDGVRSDSGTGDRQWELRWDGTDGSDGCTIASDVDGDGLVGCGPNGDDGDPDCWRFCTPECPPATSCPAGRPRCGDGTCDSAETCQICPQDCVTGCVSVCGDFVCDAGEACPGDCLQ